ncbi:MAG TPA: ABC transporter substrate-binding protein [Reyranella sp.]|nr:ABC transporter substrate-binding protein [Reyranella sp.]
MLKTAMALVGAASLTVMPALAQAPKKYDPGINDTQVKIGQSVPYSGPASAFGVYGRVMQAWFKMLNESGGINGRKLEFISLDNGFLPPKALEASRKMVESDGIFAEVGTLGTPPNLATRAYLNSKGVPQLFVPSGISKMDDPQKFRWTVPWYTRFDFEAVAYAKYLIQDKPGARLAILYQNDDFGRDYLHGFRKALGERTKMIVSEASFDLTDPTVDSQIISLKGSGADTLVVFGTPKFTAQAIRKSADLGWNALRIVCSPGSSIDGALKPAGLEISTGVLTSQLVKDPDDAAFSREADVQDYLVFMKKWAPQESPRDSNAIAAYLVGQIFEYVVRRAGDELTRENVLRQATTLQDVKLRMLLPGVLLNNSPASYTAFRRYQMSRFDGSSWKPFGPVYGAD